MKYLLILFLMLFSSVSQAKYAKISLKSGSVAVLFDEKELNFIECLHYSKYFNVFQLEIFKITSKNSRRTVYKLREFFGTGTLNIICLNPEQLDTMDIDSLAIDSTDKIDVQL